MGQRPFYPPNVSGWEQNEAWLSTSSLRMRFQAAASLLHDAIEDGSMPGEAHARAGARALARVRGTAVDEQGDRPPRSRPTAVAASPGRDEKWEVKHYWPERERVLRQVLLAGPDAQVC